MKIALVGSTLSRLHAPYGRRGWSVWAHACVHALRGMSDKRVDLWFELHRPSVRAQAKTWDPHYQDWLARRDRAPIMLQRATRAVPHSETFPRQAIEAWARSRGLQTGQIYATSTLSWMILLALTKEPSEIGIWGCNFAQKEEYRVQRPCVEYWIGAARALGVTVTLAPTSPLCRSRHIYGYDGHRPDLVPSVMPPTPLMVLPPDADPQTLPPLTVIPKEVRTMAHQQKELYGEL